MNATNIARPPRHRAWPPVGALLGLFGLLLSACSHYSWEAGGTMVDPRFHGLAAQAEPNPPRDAIVGMWNEKKRETLILTEHGSRSILFSRDGTGLFRSWWKEYSELDLFNTPPFVVEHRFVWRPATGGRWTAEYTDHTERWEIRLAGGKVLVEEFSPKGTCEFRLVFERVQ